MLIAKRKQNKDIDQIMTNFVIKSELLKDRNQIITLGTISKANIRQICKNINFKFSDIFAQDDLGNSLYLADSYDCGLLND